jgi:hypothetical protein
VRATAGCATLPSRPPGPVPARAASGGHLAATAATFTLGGERDARRTLRGQIAQLERELVEQRCSSWPRSTTGADAPGREQPAEAGGPRLLSLGELERMRDDLVAGLSSERRALAGRTLAEDDGRRLREELILDPAAHPGARVTNAEVGEGGCGAVRSEPAGGLLGMLMGWWRVIVSSGCP